MTLVDLCNFFDRSEIVDTQMDIDRDYYVSVDTIFTDGEYKTTIGTDGYLQITSVHDATYLMFVDIEHKIYLCIYKYIPESKYKHILQRLQLLKIAINKLNGTNNDEDDIDNVIEDLIDDDVIDINNFACTECDNNHNFKFKRLKTNPEIICTKCNICYTEYTLTPSKYYKIASKKTINFKSEKSSRSIHIITE